MKSDDRQLALCEATSAAVRAGEEVSALARRQALEIWPKRGTEIVTSADLRSDEVIRSHLLTCFPSHRLYSEEAPVEGQLDFSGLVWIIDPLDGTSNLAHGHPYVSISAALLEDGAPILGVVHAPFLGETYAAIRGSGATLNGNPIRVSEVTDLKRALVGTGFPHDRSDMSRPTERVRRLVTKCQDVRRTGSPALDISWVACGRLDAHCESLPPWDIAAAGLIAKEAGAVCGCLSDKDSALPPALRGEDYLAAAPGVFEQLRQLLTF